MEYKGEFLALNIMTSKIEKTILHQTRLSYDQNFEYLKILKKSLNKKFLL